jgi:hypothetical protein
MLLGRLGTLEKNDRQISFIGISNIKSNLSTTTTLGTLKLWVVVDRGSLFRAGGATYSILVAFKTFLA